MPQILSASVIACAVAGALREVLATGFAGAGAAAAGAAPPKLRFRASARSLPYLCRNASLNVAAMCAAPSQSDNQKQSIFGLRKMRLFAVFSRAWCCLIFGQWWNYPY
jgi:hypothetical protein